MAGWRYYAQRILGGTWLDRDVELYDVEITWALSGPGALTAKVDPNLAKRRALDGLLVLQEWSTVIYAERDGQIRWGGIVHSSEEEEGGSRSIECVGFSSYPKGRIYDSTTYKLWIPDAFDIIRLLWTFVQSDIDGNIGITVDTQKAGYTLGDPINGPKPSRSDYASTALYNAAVVEWTNYSGEAYSLAWWNSVDCGDEIDNIIAEAGAWYYELHSWIDSSKTAVAHRIKLGASGTTRKRDDLRFVEGENIAVPPYAKRDGDAYANQLQAVGAGEERFMLRENRGERAEGILRRDKVVSAKDVLSPSRLQKMANDELILAKDIIYFDSFEVFDHPNAPIGSFQPGDEIHVQTFSGFEHIDRWMKITEYTISAEENESVKVTVTRL